MSVWHGINCPFCGQLHAGLPCPSVKGSREVWYPVHHYHGGGEWENAHTAPIGLVTDEQAEILSLRAKLQAAEAMVATAHPPKMIRDLVAKLQAAEEALAADDQASHIIEWKSRAEAAEAEVSAARSVAGGFVKPPFDGSLAGAIDAISMRCASAEAEVARLTDCLETQYEINRNTARAACEARGDHFDAEDRIEELEAEVAILKDVRATEQYLASLTVGDKELGFAVRTATEAALRWAWNEYINSNFVIDPNGFIERGLLDLLVEK